MSRLFIFLILISPAAWGEVPATLLETLRDNGVLSEEQYQQLAAEPPTASGRVEFSEQGGLRLLSADGLYSLHIGGRVEVHSAWYEDDGVDMGDGAILRRMRISLKGKLAGNWLYKYDYDVAADSLRGVLDAYIGYRRSDGITFFAGNYRVPYSLEFQANPHAITFMERALPVAFAPGWRLGLAVQVPGRNWMLEAGVFGDRAFKASTAADSESLLAARFSGRPFRSGNRFLHLGAAVMYGSPGDQQNWRYRSTPESRVTSVAVVDTQAISGVQNYTQQGLEAAYNHGRFNLQTEYMAVDLKRSPHDLAFSGGYAQASLFLTRDSRRYKAGRFVPVQPRNSWGHGGHGAWEVAARYSTLDLNDRDVQGGEMTNLTVALNLYATRQVRFTAEHVRVLEGPTEPNAFQLRAEWVL